jgi:beta-lactamase class A
MRKPLVVTLTVLAALSIAAPCAHPQAAHRAILRGKLERDLRQLADGYKGVVGIAVLDLNDASAAVAVNDTLVFPQGSAIKIPILIELFRQGDQKAGLLRERHDITSDS